MPLPRRVSPTRARVIATRVAAESGSGSWSPILIICRGGGRGRCGSRTCARCGSGRRSRWTTVLGTERGKGVRADYRCTSAAPGERYVWEQDIEGTPFERILRSAALEIHLDGRRRRAPSVTLARQRAAARALAARLADDAPGDPAAPGRGAGRDREGGGRSRESGSPRTDPAAAEAELREPEATGRPAEPDARAANEVVGVGRSREAAPGARPRGAGHAALRARRGRAGGARGARVGCHARAAAAAADDRRGGRARRRCWTATSTACGGPPAAAIRTWSGFAPAGSRTRPTRSCCREARPRSRACWRSARGRASPWCRSAAARASSAGVEPLRGAFERLISLDLRRLQGVEVDRRSLTATLGPGLRGPEAEEALAAQGVTLGHFPQSFEYATIGGFAATRSAGQASSGYGRFDELVTSMRLTAPAGTLAHARDPAQRRRARRCASSSSAPRVRWG